MSVKRTIRTRLYAEDLPLILETLEKKGCEYRCNSRIGGFQRQFDIAVKINGKYSLGLSKTGLGDESHFHIHCDTHHVSAKVLEKWKGDFEAQVKALQIKQQLSLNGYILTGFEENNERIVLRIQQAI
jgi:hypothetical protein